MEGCGVAYRQRDARVIVSFVERPERHEHAEDGSCKHHHGDDGG